MEGLKTSVALCTYNGSRFLREQLDSIAAQTYRPAELVICDDCSLDETLCIIKNFMQTAPFPVRIEVNAENLGSTRNFEKAIGMCQGEITALSDQDDIWEPHKLETISRVFEKRPDIGYVFSNAMVIDARGDSTGLGLWESVNFTAVAFEEFTSGSQVGALLRRSLVTGATMCFRSKLNEVVMPFSSHFIHDSWISMVASCLGMKGVPIPYKLMRYRQHSAQQIGPRQKSIRERATFLRKAGYTECEQARLAMIDLRQCLLSAKSQGFLIDGLNMHFVEEKLDHCSRRTYAHKLTGLTRVQKVLSEVLTGRYGRFSNSWRSILADLRY